jgi:predicted Zn-dependent protease with MMP-like domain
MTRERFRKLVAEALDALPARFRQRIRNVAVVVEDYPAEQGPPENIPEDRDLLMGVFDGVMETERSFFSAASGPARVVLYQKNIEAVCDTDDEIREEIRLTVLHEFGHYFGMDEDQLADV